MKTLFLTVLFMAGMAVQSMGADVSTNAGRQNQSANDRESRLQGSADNLLQKKTEIIQHIEERISNSQSEKICVQAAQSQEEIRTCRDKYRPKKLQDGNQQR